MLIEHFISKVDTFHLYFIDFLYQLSPDQFLPSWYNDYTIYKYDGQYTLCYLLNTDINNKSIR